MNEHNQHNDLEIPPCLTVCETPVAFHLYVGQELGERKAEGKINSSSLHGSVRLHKQATGQTTIWFMIHREKTTFTGCDFYPSFFHGQWFLVDKLYLNQEVASACIPDQPPAIGTLLSSPRLCTLSGFGETPPHQHPQPREGKCQISTLKDVITDQLFINTQCHPQQLHNTAAMYARSYFPHSSLYSAVPSVLIARTKLLSC